MGKESDTEGLYVYVQVIHSAVPKKLTKHYKAIILKQKLVLKKCHYLLNT